MNFGTSEIVLILGNAAALIWGAASLKASVGSLERSAGKLDEAISRMVDQIHEHDTRIAVLEAERKPA